MNIKPGELAIVVACRNVGDANKTHIGKIVTTTRKRHDETWETDPVLWDADCIADDVWLSLEESELKPLRDNPGTDETLTWSPVPSKLKEKA